VIPYIADVAAKSKHFKHLTRTCSNLCPKSRPSRRGYHAGMHSLSKPVCCTSRTSQITSRGVCVDLVPRHSSPIVIHIAELHSYHGNHHIYLDPILLATAQSISFKPGRSTILRRLCPGEKKKRGTTATRLCQSILSQYTPSASSQPRRWWLRGTMAYIANTSLKGQSLPSSRICCGLSACHNPPSCLQSPTRPRPSPPMHITPLSSAVASVSPTHFSNPRRRQRCPHRQQVSVSWHHTLINTAPNRYPYHAPSSRARYRSHTHLPCVWQSSPSL